MALPHRALSRHAIAITSSSSRSSLARSNAPQNNIISRRPINQRSSLLVQIRTKRTSAAKDNDRKAAVSRAISENQTKSSSSNNASTSTSTSNSGKTASAKSEYLFGLRPVDYSKIPPVRQPPPPPPSKPGMQRYLWPALLLFTAGTVGYFYVNNKNDNYAYWEAMQSGAALEMDDDDDDDDEYYDDEEEEFEDDGVVVETETETKQISLVAGDGAGDAGNVTETKQKRGWFGWLRRRGGNDVSR